MTGTRRDIEVNNSENVSCAVAQIRQNKLSDAAGRRVRLPAWDRKALEETWSRFEAARRAFACSRLRSNYDELKEAGDVLVREQSRLGVLLIHPANVAPGLWEDDPRIIDDKTGAEQQFAK